MLYLPTVRQGSREFSISLSMTFSWTLKEIFPAIENPSSLLSKLSLYFLSQVFHYFFFLPLPLFSAVWHKHKAFSWQKIHRKILSFLCPAKSCAKAFFMSSAHLWMVLIKTNSQMMLPNDFFSHGGSTEKDNRYTLQHCSQGSLCKQGEKLIGSLLGRDKFARIQKH